jgi:hypothetical protein
MELDDLPATDGQRSVVAALRDMAAPFLDAAADSLGWRQPLREESRDGAVHSYSVRALHTYGNRLAMVAIRLTSESEPTVDMRVYCELADAEIFNAERIVRVAAAEDPEVQEWLQTQLGRCLNALQARVRAR